MFRRDFLALSASTAVLPNGAIAQLFDEKQAAAEIAGKLCQREGVEWRVKIEPDFILIFRRPS